MTADKDFKQMVRAYAREHQVSYVVARRRLLESRRAPKGHHAQEDHNIMKFTRTVPVLRTFDAEKAREFYVDFLGMTIDWEHRFEPGLPLYQQVSRGDLALHLTEHHGDATPGSHVYVYMDDVAELHAELIEKATVGHNQPGLNSVDGRTEFMIIDPFGNRLRFGQLDAKPS